MLPLVSRALIMIDGPIVAAPPLQAAVRELWGLSIPENVIRFMLPKLEVSGELKYEHQAYLKVDLPDRGRFERAEKTAEAVYARVRSGIQRLLLIHEISEHFTPDQVIERFLDTGGTAFLTNAPRIPYADPNDLQINILMVEYMGLDQGRQEGPEFDDVLSLVIGDVLYKAITALSESDLSVAENGRMHDVQVLFDTSVLLRLMRYEQADLQKPAVEMLKLAQATGCKVSIFQHTFDELQAILRAIADTAYSSRKKSSLVRRVESLGIAKSDLVEDAELLVQTLFDLGISVVDAPIILEPLSINERDLDTHLQSRIGYKRQEAKVRDVASLTAVYRLRHGEIRKRLENCNAIFITTNTNLAAASTDFFRNLFKEENKVNVVQHCMSDVVFTMRMWLKLPSEFSSVPRSSLIAHALSTLRPHDALYDTFLDYLAKLVAEGSLTDDQSVRVRFGALATPTLMIETEGRVDALTEGTTARIISRILAQQDADKAGAIEEIKVEERERNRKNIEELQINLDDKIAAHEADLDAERTRTKKTQIQVDELKLAQKRTENALEALAYRFATWGEKAVTLLAYLVILLLVLVCAIDALENIPVVDSFEKRVGKSLVHVTEVGLSLVLAVLAFKGLSYRDMARQLRESIHKGFLTAARKTLGLDET